jgi:hypothetical protein
MKPGHRAERVQHAHHIGQDRAHQLLEGIPDDGDPGAADTVRAWGLLCRPAQALHDHGGGLAAADRADHEPHPGVVEEEFFQRRRW